MYYFKKSDDVIEKYQVHFEKEEVKKLQEKIINRCSVIKHVNFEGEDIPKILDKRFIRNLKYTRIGKKEYFEETRDIYSIQYDRYEPPYLAAIIERILGRDFTAIGELLHYQVSNSTSIEEKINLVNTEMISIPLSDIAKKKQKLEELEDLLKEKARSEEISSYYEQLISLFQFEFVDSIPVSELERVKEFLGLSFASLGISIDSSDAPFAKVLKK